MVNWNAADVDEVAGVVRQVAPAGIDLHGLTRAQVGDGFLEDDGVHPTPAGQRLILAHIVAGLCTGPKTF